MARFRLRLHRAVIFGGIALAVPLGACKYLSTGDDADAGPGAQPVATVTIGVPPTATQAPASAAPSASVAPLVTSSAGGRRVVVKLPDGGMATVDASIGPDGAVVLPPGFQFPTFPGFDAAALKIPAFDAASLPPFPSGFPKIPGFVAPDGGAGK